MERKNLNGVLDLVSRRDFLRQTTALSTLAAFTGAPLAAFAQGSSMRRRPIPRVNESLPIIGLGSPDIFIDLPSEGKDLPKSVIQAMVDLGGRVIDTPSFFRPNVPILGDLLTEMDLQKRLFLTGKITVDGKQEGIDHLEKLVANLNKTPIDLLLVHNMREMDRQWPTLKAWKEQGRVRYIGVSLTRTTDYTELEKFMTSENPDFIMTGYSITQPLAEERVLPLAMDNGIGVIGVEPFKAFDDGAFFNMVADKALPEWASEFDCESWAQFSLKHIISHPAITCVVTETSKVKHVIDNMHAGYGKLPDQAMREQMIAHLLSLA